MRVKDGDRPIVSVVMPIYDGERYVAEAIESILAQTLTAFEFVIVDDGSTDATSRILENYAGMDARIRVLTQAHAGVTEAANRGCRAARTEFVARMDSDDVSAPSRLETQVQFLRTHPDVGIVGADIREFNDEGSFEPPARSRPLEPDFIQWSLMFGNCVAHPTTTIRRAVLKRLDYYRVDAAEDYDLLIRATEITKIANLPDVLLNYRISHGQLTRRITTEQTHRTIDLQQSLMAGLLHRSVPRRLVEVLRENAMNAVPASNGEIDAAADLLCELQKAYTRKIHPNRADSARIALDVQWRLEKLRPAPLPPNEGPADESD